MSARQLAAANERRWKLLKAWEDMFSGADGQSEGFDILICPCALTAAYEHDHSEAVRPFFTPSARKIKVDGIEVEYQNNVFWSGVCNAPGLPSVAFPVALA